MANSIKILYIDDENDNLVAFKALLRLNYQVFITTDTEEAIRILNEHSDLRVVFCDQRMPLKTGVEFFEEIHSKGHPAVRILLTGYTDAQATMAAINKGHIFRYVQKPWVETELYSAIEEANLYYQATSALALKNEELHRAYEELNKFASVVTHDVRGPLTSVLSAIYAANDSGDILEIKEILALMEKSVKKLDSYIISMYDYYSVRRGELKMSAIDFFQLSEELKLMYEISSVTNGVRIEVSVVQSTVFYSEKEMLRLILSNLLSNALKYRDKQKDDKWVKLDINIKNGEAIITVKDNGMGIPDRHIRDIFNLFYRASSEETGSGVGLYNVKSALNKLKGQIEVNSNLGQGTCFNITVPGAIKTEVFVSA